MNGVGTISFMWRGIQSCELSLNEAVEEEKDVKASILQVTHDFTVSFASKSIKLSPSIKYKLAV